MVAESKSGWAAGAAAIAGIFMAAPANAAYEEELSGSGPVLLSNVAYGDAPAPAPAAPAMSDAQRKSKAGHSARSRRQGTRRQSHAQRQGRASKHRAAPVKALGSNVPYDAAVQLVCPNGWTVDSRAHSDKRVGWNAGEPWTSALDRISSRAGLQARVDWKNKTVTIMKASGRSSGAVKKDKFRAGRKDAKHYRSSRASKTLLTPAAEPGRAYLSRTATAREAARAAGASEGEFCSWNSLATPHARLVAGMAVWTQAPGAAGASSAPLPPYAPPSGDMQPSMVQAPNRLESAAETKAISSAKTTAPAPKASAELAAPDVYGANSSFRLAPGTLIAQVSRWCDQSGYQLVWKADRDVEIVSHVQYRGSFTSSLQNLFRDLSKAGQPFRVSVYEANRVVEVNEN